MRPNLFTAFLSSMSETQYDLFRDLDRHCVAHDFDPDACREAVRRKRALIEFHQNNPIVRDVLEGRQTFVQAYEVRSRAFRGVRRFIPHRDVPEWNQRLEDLGRIIPNVGHFTKRGLFSIDNPVMCALYGAGGALGVSLSLVHAQRDDRRGGGSGSLIVGDDFPLSFTLLMGIFGFLLGLFAMLRYRTRDARRIHAREAARYMDLNYAFYRNNDDEGWAHCVRSRTDLDKAPLARRPRISGS